MNQARKTDQPATPLVRWIAAQRDAGRTMVMVCETDRQVGRLSAVLEPHGVEAVSGQPFPKFFGRDRFSSAGATCLRGLYGRPTALP